MANIEQTAGAEATAKGLSGQARKSYIGGVFNRIRQAHARAVQPGKGKTFLSNLNRRNRQLARARYQEALRPHEQAVADLKRQRKQELAQLSYEKPPREPGQRPATPAAPPAPKRPPAERQRQRAIAQAIQHGAPDFPPGTLAAAQGQPTAKPAKAPPIPRFERGALKPIKERPIGFQLDATRELDPYFIREYFGEKQLPKALAMQPQNNLAEATGVVERKTGKRYTGSRSNRAEMYHWILANM